MHTLFYYVNTIIPNIPKHIWKGTPMKIGRLVIFISIVIYFPLLFSAHLRILNQIPINIGHQYAYKNPKQLLNILKKDIQNLNYKSNILNNSATETTLQKIAAAMAINTKFKPFLNEIENIQDSIEQFHKIPGYLSVFARIIHSTANTNTACFNGAMAEILLARKLVLDKKILEFNKIIMDENGKPYTEVDIEAEALDGTTKAWYEVKIRKRFRTKQDIASIKKQASVQKSLAKQYGINQHQMIIVKNLNEIDSLTWTTNKNLDFNSKVIDGKGNQFIEIDNDSEDNDH